MFVGHDKLRVRQDLVFPVNIQKRADGATVLSKIGKLNPVHFPSPLCSSFVHSNPTSKYRKSKGMVPINEKRPHSVEPRKHECWHLGIHGFTFLARSTPLVARSALTPRYRGYRAVPSTACDAFPRS